MNLKYKPNIHMKSDVPQLFLSKCGLFLPLFISFIENYIKKKS